MRFWALGIVALLGALTGEASAKVDRASQSKLNHLGDEAGAILTFRPTLLKAGYELAQEALPQQRGAINLVALGATTVLGFDPFRPPAWVAAGFDPKSRIMVQLPSTTPKGELWRTRVVLKTRSTKKVLESLNKFRLRKRVLLKGKTRGLATVIAGIDGQEVQLQKHFKKAGVVFAGAPGAGGLVLARVSTGLLIVDILVPRSGASLEWGHHGDEIRQVLRPAKQPLSMASPGADSLARSDLGLWLRPFALSSVLGQGRECGTIQQLMSGSDFESLGISLGLDASQLRLEIDFSLRPQSDLPKHLRARPTSATASESGDLVFGLQLQSLSSLRDRARGNLPKTWDRLWADSRTCGGLSKTFALAFAWPEIAGFFLAELSSLAPSAKRVIDNLKGMKVVLEGETARGEAWLATPADADARRWLARLFGHKSQQDHRTRWGRGPWLPYALSVPGGSIFGIGIGHKAQKLGLTAARPKAQANDQIISIYGNLALLAKHPSVPLQGFWKLWKRGEGHLRSTPDSVRFVLDLVRVQKPR